MSKLNFDSPSSQIECSGILVLQDYTLVSSTLRFVLVFPFTRGSVGPIRVLYTLPPGGKEHLFEHY